jgi:hypothetical protein
MLILDLAAPRRARWTWRQWSTLDPLTREYEGERVARGVAWGVVLAFGVWTAAWLIWRLA